MATRMKVNDPRLEFLNLLERAESKLLTWGLVDGSFSSDEIAERCEEFLDARDLWDVYQDEDLFQESLAEAGLLYGFRDGMRQRFRTRMAETLRLLVRLRQLFPQHMEGASRRWQISKPLVGDFRLILRPRTVPARDLHADQVRTRLEQSCPLSSLQLQVLDKILSLQNGDSIRLANFQVRATENILAQLRHNRSSGTIVCAGTGSGKTLSFYLPAFISISQTIDTHRWTRCLAIYPRNELLKDQLSEAFKQARKLDSVFHSTGKRKLTIGTLFGATPEHEGSFNYSDPPPGWTLISGGTVCPYLRCPSDNCEGQMIWRTEDRERKLHRLRCTRCATATEDDELILTRQRLQCSPPDILFTTTEMLNQRIGDSEMSHVYGIGAPRNKKPAIVLLDEVHTYSGVSGAQTAMLLRRWKHAADVRPHFVGLSATLADARRFFATLIGEQDSRVEEVSPHPIELNRVGMEYLVALRNDPASQSSLLSTSIQIAMLMRRTLDAVQNNAAPQSGVYGSKTFVFTDDLDVTNRMFYNLRDAEGQDSWGRPDRQRHPTGSLANLRNPQLPDERQRNRFGQSWNLCTWLGHRLQDGTASLRIDRTSSQDTGVATNADIIVATAALEVGFNDPEVNVVLQHKAPRDTAQFIQRKGRAGRRIEMRPWTIVALSDYGRDRLAWESFDLLFDPELAPRELPIRNRYVLRMQVVFAFFDWMAHQLSQNTGLPKGSVYRDFSGPADEILRNESNITRMRTRQQAAAAVIEGLLLRDERYNELIAYLQKALQQPEAEIETLVWEPPRALMTAALPTLLRRLTSDWRICVNSNSTRDHFIRNNPLPEFVPAQLFGDLNLPEVTLRSPAQQKNTSERLDVLPILQAMREFAPGRVSRRFGVMNTYARHWIRPRDLTTSGPQSLELRHIVSRYDELGLFERFNEHGDPEVIRCVRPREMQLVVPDRRVMDSSNAVLTWNTQINASVAGASVDMPTPSRWSAVIAGLRFFAHNLCNPLEVRRFATSSKATISFDNGKTTETTLQFIDDQIHDSKPSNPKTIGIGFAVDVDGLVLHLRFPSDLANRLPENAAMLRCLRVSRFRDQVTNDPTLGDVANVFQLRWLSQIYLSGLVTSSITQGCTLAEAWVASMRTAGSLNLQAVLGVIFQSIAVSTQNKEESNDADEKLHDVQQKLQSDLEQLLKEELVIASLQRHSPTLWETPDDTWVPWLIRKFKATVGAAVLDAIQQVCPDLDAGDLLLDLESGPQPLTSVERADHSEKIWITERTVGGGGIIESFVVRYGEDPRRFFDLLENALRPSDYEIADQQLTVLLDWLLSPNEVEIKESVSLYRDAASRDHQSHADAFDRLRTTLTKRGLFTCHSVITAMANRILRPGSSDDTDALIHRLISRWRLLEHNLGVEIDPRILAYLESTDDSIDGVIHDPGDNAIEVNRRQWRFNTLLSLLWPRGGLSRSARLAVVNPFNLLPEADHDLVRLFLSGEPERVSVDNAGWRELASEYLIRDSEVILVAAPHRLRALRDALMDIMTLPIDSGFLLLHPKVKCVNRFAQSVELGLMLPEGMQ